MGAHRVGLRVGHVVVAVAQRPRRLVVLGLVAGARHARVLRRRAAAAHVHVLLNLAVHLRQSADTSFITCRH